MLEVLFLRLLMGLTSLKPVFTFDLTFPYFLADALTAACESIAENDLSGDTVDVLNAILSRLIFLVAVFGVASLMACFSNAF